MTLNGARAGRGEKRADQLDTPHFRDERLLDFLLDEHVLDLVEKLIGPNIGLWSSHFISKEPKIGRPTPWHSDAGYWKGRFEQFTGLVTIWLAIDPAANTFARELSGLDESQAVYFQLEPNECSFHDSRLIHGAKANTSDRRRTGYTMRYFSQDMKLVDDHPSNKGFRIWHCRGENPHGNPVVNG
ncbi:MAG: phytanoyl-CoA dioxygenase family protein [Spirochaetales bacterium]